MSMPLDARNKGETSSHVIKFQQQYHQATGSPTKRDNSSRRGMRYHKSANARDDAENVHEDSDGERPTQ